MRNLNAEVIRVKGNYEDSLNFCKEESKKNNWEIIQDVAWPDYELVPKLTMAGYSTMIKEISVQTNEYITHIFLQAGVGGMAAGLVAGVANYFKKVPKIIIVEPENANCVMKSIENNTPTSVDIKKESIMGGMSCGEVSLVPWKILNPILKSENVSETRAEEMRSLNAEVIRVKGNYEDSLNFCKVESKKKNWEIIQDVAWPDYELVPKLTMAGYSTMIKEISVQTNEYVTHIFLQAGVGGMAAGLVAGVAHYFKKVPKIIIVEPENANCVMQSIENNTPTSVDIKKESIMGGMSCGDVSLVPWQILKNSVNNCVSVSDKFVSQTVAMLADRMLSDISIVGGECATPGITSLISCCNNKETKSALDINENSNILLIGCEGSADVELYQKLLNEGKKLI